MSGGFDDNGPVLESRQAFQLADESITTIAADAEQVAEVFPLDTNRK